mgnify:CR=1 FL=1
MYKVFFNRTEFLIVEKSSLNKDDCHYLKQEYCNEFPSKKECLLWLNEDKELSYIFETEEVEKCWSLFKESFKLILAAGGLVFNNENKLLTIFRNGVWDLPKGKVEKGEQIREAAKREVEEETGCIINSQNEMPTAHVYHVYQLKKKLVLKTTTWYKMSSNPSKLLPQREEGITEVRWMSQSEIENIFNVNTYPSIKKIAVF